MYKVYPMENGAVALICFTGKVPINKVFEFQEKIAEKILAAHKLCLSKNIEGVDSWFTFFDEKDKSFIENFYKKRLSLLAGIFKTKRWKEYQAEWKNIRELFQIELVTSHDHPCIVMDSSLHKAQELSNIIQEVSVVLNIEMPLNSDLPSMEEIIMSNRTFDLST